MEDTARFCESCGASASAPSDTGEGWVKATAETPMTHCGKCKRQVPLYGDEKCPYCGAVVHEPTGPVCPVCGTQMQDAARECVVCGAEIPGKYDKKPAKRVLRWMVYRKPNGLYGISIVGWIVLTVLVVAIMGMIALIKVITV